MHKRHGTSGKNGVRVRGQKVEGPVLEKLQQQGVQLELVRGHNQIQNKDAEPVSAQIPDKVDRDDAGAGSDGIAGVVSRGFAAYDQR